MIYKNGVYIPPLDDTPVDAELEKAPTSNWAFDHAADADAHHPEEIPEGRGRYGATNLLIIPGVEASTPALVAYTLDRVYYFPCRVRTPITVDQITIEVTTAAAAGEKCRAGIYAADINWQPVVLQVASAEIAIDANAVVDTGITATILQEGRYLLAFTLEGTATMRAIRYGSFGIGFIPTMGGNINPTTLYVAKAYAALATTGTAWDSYVAGSGGFLFAIFLGVLTP